jgi:hypothetical protein
MVGWDYGDKVHMFVKYFSPTQGCFEVTVGVSNYSKKKNGIVLCPWTFYVLFEKYDLVGIKF